MLISGYGFSMLKYILLKLDLKEQHYVIVATKHLWRVRLSCVFNKSLPYPPSGITVASLPQQLMTYFLYISVISTCAPPLIHFCNQEAMLQSQVQLNSKSHLQVETCFQVTQNNFLQNVTMKPLIVHSKMHFLTSIFNHHLAWLWKLIFEITTVGQHATVPLRIQ